jgi:hypothetical protein
MRIHKLLRSLGYGFAAEGDLLGSSTRNLVDIEVETRRTEEINLRRVIDPRRDVVVV